MTYGEKERRRNYVGEGKGRCYHNGSFGFIPYSTGSRPLVRSQWHVIIETLFRSIQVSFGSVGEIQDWMVLKEYLIHLLVYGEQFGLSRPKENGKFEREVKTEERQVKRREEK